MKTTKETLKNEIESHNVEPNVQMFVDESSIFWVTKSGYFVWIQDHNGINDYIDEKHEMQDLNKEDFQEGVGTYGVFWLNQDFESPFHISDFLERIESI